MNFAAVVGRRSGRATPALRDVPQRQSMETVGWETIYRNRNAVQTNPATSAYDVRRSYMENPDSPRSRASKQVASVPDFATH